MSQERSLRDIGPDKSLLLVDDDEPFLRRLQRAMEKRGFEVEAAETVTAGKAIAMARPPAYALSICGLKMAMAWMLWKHSARNGPMRGLSF